MTTVCFVFPEKKVSVVKHCAESPFLRNLKQTVIIHQSSTGFRINVHAVDLPYVFTFNKNAVPKLAARWGSTLKHQ